MSKCTRWNGRQGLLQFCRAALGVSFALWLYCSPGSYNPWQFSVWGEADQSFIVAYLSLEQFRGVYVLHSKPDEELLRELSRDGCYIQADVEALLSASSDKKPPERIDELEGFIKKHQDQTTKLEQVLRLVENEQVRLQFCL